MREADDIAIVGASRVASWAVLVGGCNAAFGVKEVPPPDAAVPQLCQNLTPHDEDGDGVVDGCDVCPGIPDPDQADTDTDGVGDACDPSTTHDHLAMFESFAEPGVAQKWQVMMGTWAFKDDAAVYESTMQGFAYITAVNRPDPPFTVEVGVTIDAIMPQGSFIDVFGDMAVQCGPIRHSATSIDVVRVENNETTENMETEFTPLHAGQRLRLTMTYDRTKGVQCAALDRDLLTVASTSLPLAGITPSSFGIREDAIPAHIEYIAVYAPVP